MQLSDEELQTNNNPIKIKPSTGRYEMLAYDLLFLMLYGFGYYIFPFPLPFFGGCTLFHLRLMLAKTNMPLFFLKEGSSYPILPFGTQQNKRPLQCLQNLQNYFQKLRNTNSIKINPSLFIPKSKIQNDTPPFPSLLPYAFVIAEYKLNLQFANDQSRIKYEQMIDGNLQMVNEKSVPPGVASELNRFLWKNKQVYINTEFPSRYVFWSYIILSFLCLDWLVELYASKRVVQCEIIITKIFNIDQEENSDNIQDMRVEKHLTEQELQINKNPIKVQQSWYRYLWCGTLCIDLFYSMFLGSGYWMLYSYIFDTNNSPPLLFAIFLFVFTVLHHAVFMFVCSSISLFLLKEDSNNQSLPFLPFGSFENKKPLQNQYQFQHHFQQLRNANSIKISPDVFIPESKIQNETPSEAYLPRHAIVIAYYKLKMRFANDQSRIKYEQMIDGKLQMIDEKLVPPEVASEQNRFIWKNKQMYINAEYSRRCVLCSYIILSFLCLDWLVELYVNLRRLVVQCEVTITKSFNENEKS